MIWTFTLILYRTVWSGKRVVSEWNIWIFTYTVKMEALYTVEMPIPIRLYTKDHNMNDLRLILNYMKLCILFDREHNLTYYKETNLKIRMLHIPLLHTQTHTHIYPHTCSVLANIIPLIPVIIFLRNCDGWHWNVRSWKFIFKIQPMPLKRSIKKLQSSVSHPSSDTISQTCHVFLFQNFVSRFEGNLFR
jgi:hypothetical protein